MPYDDQASESGTTDAEQAATGGEAGASRTGVDGGAAGAGGRGAATGGAGGDTDLVGPAPLGGDSGPGDGGTSGDGGGASDGGSSFTSPPNPCLSACNGHGRCAPSGDDAVCTCDEGFDGPDCFARNGEYGRRALVLEDVADPDVFKIDDDRFVLSGTGSGKGFDLYESSNLDDWTQVGSYDPSAVDPSHDYCFCWAPEIAEVDGSLRLYFSAHRGPKGATTCPPPTGSDVTTYVATSPDGSFEFGVPELVLEGQGGAAGATTAGCPAGDCALTIRLDPAVHDERLYYVFFDGGNNIASTSLTNPADVRVHAGPSSWSLASYEEAINEAPEVVDHGGSQHLFFSAARYDDQYATFYVSAAAPGDLDRDQLVRRLTTPVRRADGTLLETHGSNSITTRRGETFSFFTVGVFDGVGNLTRRHTYRQRIVWNPDGTAMSQTDVRVSWNALGGGNEYSLDVVLRDGTTIGPCIAVGRIGESTSTTFNGVCPDASDRLVHKSEVRAFRLFASSTDVFVQVGETPYDGYSDVVDIVATAP